MNQKIAIIIGAGPAGLTAAYEFLDRTEIKPIVYEMSDSIGGISKTINYKGNRIDLGGHRFFSKSDKVMNWWEKIFPLQGGPSRDDIFLKRNAHLSEKSDAPDPERTDRVMLIRNRLSRIFFLRKFFDYPISLNLNTLSNLGIIRIIKIGISYIKIRLFPIKEEKSLEDFFMNRFGKELYLTFFKDYTEKVWGASCDQIKPEWGAQRIKGLSITKAILNAIKNVFPRKHSLVQEDTETSLIQRFLYPKFGPGQLWEEVAGIIKKKGGEVNLRHRVVGLKCQGNKVIEVNIKNELTGDIITKNGDYFFSTMPVKELIQSFLSDVPQDVKQVAQGLNYRDFMTVGLLLKKLKIKNKTKIKTINNIVPDNWIYVQEKDVKIARFQIFNNWSPYMVKDENTVWIGLEYLCNKGDDLWEKSDKDFTRFATDELVKIDIIEKDDILDSVVVRMPSAYPAYFGTYDRFQVIRNFVDKFENLFLIGRNGMHRYNNQDHSMLTAMVAVDNILAGHLDKSNIWEINTEQTYHENKKN
ncbi:MAG: NAD(P)/FAD-dependent oxidoreductase [Nanoarchaeota archaeon]|nr:NAD(P)/FAD-dependent oxidoreductase [Nanoarchaeota archaeon]